MTRTPSPTTRLSRLLTPQLTSIDSPSTGQTVGCIWRGKSISSP